MQKRHDLLRLSKRGADRDDHLFLWVLFDYSSFDHFPKLN